MQISSTKLVKYLIEKGWKTGYLTSLDSYGSCESQVPSTHCDKTKNLY